VAEREALERFERLVLPHLGAGYNLARWMTRSEHDAEDVVQAATLRAFRSFDRYRGGDPRAWMLTIVRNTCYSWLRQNRTGSIAAGVGGEVPELPADPASEPEVQYLRQADRQLLQAALEALPAEFREVLVLREIEGCSYKEIAEVVDAPLGTVMSRLARARQQVQRFVLRRKEGVSP
jgi:RNA polymerase sigma factor (sigma-70 family)